MKQVEELRAYLATLPQKMNNLLNTPEKMEFFRKLAFFAEDDEELVQAAEFHYSLCPTQIPMPKGRLLNEDNERDRKLAAYYILNRFCFYFQIPFYYKAKIVFDYLDPEKDYSNGGTIPLRPGYPFSQIQEIENALAEVRSDFEGIQKKIDRDLTDTEENIIEALGTDTLKGEELLRKAGYDYSSHYRAILSNLCKRKILKKTVDGYQEDC